MVSLNILVIWYKRNSPYLPHLVSVDDRQGGFPGPGEGGRIRDQRSTGNGLHRNHRRHPLPPDQLCPDVQRDGGSQREAPPSG